MKISDLLRIRKTKPELSIAECWVLHALEKSTNTAEDTLVDDIEFQSLRNKLVERGYIKLDAKAGKKKKVAVIDREMRQNAIHIIEYMNTKKREQLGLRTSSVINEDHITKIAGFLPLYSLDDIKLTLDYLFETWGNDPRMKTYLVVDTIFKVKSDSPFSAKFEQAQIWASSKSGRIVQKSNLNRLC